MTRLEQLLYELASAARAEGIAYADSDGGDIDTIDVEDARKEILEYFNAIQEHPLVTLGEAESGCNGDNEFVVLVSFDAEMNLILEPRAVANYEGGTCSCCSCGDASVDDAEKRDDFLVLELALSIDEREPAIEELRKRTEHRRRAVQYAHAEQKAQNRVRALEAGSYVLNKLKEKKESKEES